MNSRRRTTWLSFVLFLAATAIPAVAEDAVPPGLLGHWVHGEGGISAEYVYTGEVFTNMRGGIDTNRATRYMGLLDLALSADTEKLGLWKGGNLVVFAQNMHGEGITLDFVGDRQVLSNIDAPSRMQVSEYYWEQLWFDGRLRSVIGKTDVNAEFAVVPVAGEFINSSFGFHPTILMPTYPDPSFGASVFWDVNERLHLAAGVWDGEPDGRNWGFSGSGSVFSIVEAELHYDLFGGLPGQIHGGVWHLNTPMENLVVPETEVPEIYGIQFETQQMLYAENPEEGEESQGLFAFFQYGWTPNDRFDINQYYGGGLVYHGPIQGRNDDSIGAAFAHIIFTDELPVADYETAIELFYSLQWNPWIRIQPDLQYIAHPSGEFRDAFVFGTRFEIVW